MGDYWIAQFQEELYTVSQADEEKLRITILFDPEIALYMDDFGHPPTVTFIVNICGLVGLNLRYSLLDAYGVVEKTVMIASRKLRWPSKKIASVN